MSAKRWLIAALLLVAPSQALPEESPRSLLGHVRSSSFLIDVPEGWKVAWLAEPAQSGDQQRRGRVFDITPVSTEAKHSSMFIHAEFLRNMVPSAARARWEGPISALSSELAPIEGLGSWMLVESTTMRTFTAYRSLGWDTLFIWFNAPNDALFAEAKREVIVMLRSYKEQKVMSGP